MKICCSFLVILVSFSFVGCDTKDTDESNAQKVIKDWLNMYYTIDKTDFEFYEKITSGWKKEEIAEFISYHNEYKEKFKPFLTDSLFESFEANRFFTQRINEAYAEKYYVKVANIKLEKYLEKNTENNTESKEDPMLVYYYDMELIQTSILGNETKDVKVRRQISVSKIEDSWKVRHFRTIYK